MAISISHVKCALARRNSITTQIKLTQKDGIEYIQVSNGFRHKVSLAQSTWTQILQWFENDDSYTLECDGLKFKVSSGVLEIEQGHSSVSLNADEAMSLKSAIEKRVSELSAQVPELSTEIPTQTNDETDMDEKLRARLRHLINSVYKDGLERFPAQSVTAREFEQAFLEAGYVKIEKAEGELAECPLKRGCILSIPETPEDKGCDDCVSRKAMKVQRAFDLHAIPQKMKKEGWLSPQGAKDMVKLPSENLFAKRIHAKESSNQ